MTSDELEYTIRLRHEVPTANTWRTQRIAPGVDRPGPRVVKSVIVSLLIACYIHNLS